MELGDNPDVSKCDPAFQYHVLDGLIVAGRADLALEFLRRRNCNWLRAGLETIPEVWCPGFASEISNVQATTPEAYLLDRILLGFRPLEPGCAKIEIAPLTSALEFATGTVRTPEGPVDIGWTSDDHRVQLSIDKPTGVQAYVILPDEARLVGVSGDCPRRDENEQGTVYSCVVGAEETSIVIQGVTAP